MCALVVCVLCVRVHNRSDSLQARLQPLHGAFDGDIRVPSGFEEVDGDRQQRDVQARDAPPHGSSQGMSMLIYLFLYICNMHIYFEVYIYEVYSYIYTPGILLFLLRPCAVFAVRTEYSYTPRLELSYNERDSFFF